MSLYPEHKPEISFSVVVPVFNSVSSLPVLLEGVQNVFSSYPYPFEVIFVDDKSTAGSWATLLELKKKNPDIVTLIRFTKNFGQNSATLCGIDHAKKSFVITIDDDLEVSPEEIRKLVDAYLATEADVVFGIPARHKVSLIRKIGSAGIKGFFRLFDGGTRVGSSFRLITPWVTNNIRHHSHDHLFINQVISWYTTDIKTIEIEQSKRIEGRSGYNLFHLFSIAFRLIFQYSSFPLKALIFWGMFLSAICFGFGGYYIYQKVNVGAMSGYTSLIVSIFFTTGMVLTSISILGIYVKRIYESRVKKPNYLVKVKL